VVDLFDKFENEEEDDDYNYDPKRRKNLKNVQFKKRLGAL
jgi:hypothetical protein